MSFDSTFQVLAVSFNETADQIISGGKYFDCDFTIFFKYLNYLITVKGLDNDLKVWDIRKNGLLYKLKGHTDCATGWIELKIYIYMTTKLTENNVFLRLSLSPDGSFIASNSMDNTGLFLRYIFEIRWFYDSLKLCF